MGVKEKMKVLVGCEESQTVCKAFRALGHEAYSCDLKDCSGGHPEWHIKESLLNVLNGGFLPLERGMVYMPKWDLLIAHPPCTHLARVAIRWMNDPEKIAARGKAIEFFKKVQAATIEKICIENPRPQKVVWEKVGRWTQVVQPYYFGDRASKATCLWLKGLPPLVHYKTEHVDKGEMRRGPNGKTYSLWSQANNPAKRSKTFPGIAKAMAEQWGGLAAEKVA